MTERWTHLELDAENRRELVEGQLLGRVLKEMGRRTEGDQRRAFQGEDGEETYM